MIKVRFNEDGEIPEDFSIDFNEKEINKMENKYKELADKYNIEYDEVEEKLDEFDNCIRIKSEKYDENDIKIMKDALLKVIVDQERYLKNLEKALDLEQEGRFYYMRQIDKLNYQIDALKEIIDKLTEKDKSNKITEDKSEEITEDATSFVYKDTGYGISFVHSINDLLLDLNKDGLVYFDMMNNIIYDGTVVGKLGEDLYKTMKKISESDPDTLQMGDL